MTGRIPTPLVDEIRNAVRIADVAADYVDLRHVGGLDIGLCPLHSERTPSFKIRSDYNRFHCYGCGEGGDVFDLLTKIDGITFPDAVRTVAERAGIAIATTEEDSAGATERHVRALYDDTVTILHDWLLTHPEGVNARKYLSARRFTRDHAAVWSLGFNPGRGALHRQLQQRGYSDDLLATAGLVKRGRDDKLYDPFGGRLIWPIANRSNQVCGFAGRALDDRAPKYLNSDESPRYRKRALLYGYPAARRAALTERTMVVVEGYTDVMAAHDAGFANTVASCGTAISEQQARLISACVGDEGTVVCGFDFDDAGRKAAWSLFLACQHFTSQVTAVDYSAFGAKADACDVRAASGPQTLAEVLGTRQPVLQLLLDSDCALSEHTPEQVAAAARRVADRLAAVHSPILVAHYREYAASRLGIRATDIESSARLTQPAPPTIPPAVVASRETVEVNLVAALIDAPHLIGQACTAVDVTGSHELLSAGAHRIVEMSLAGFAGGRPHTGEDAHIWADYMGEVLDPSDHSLLWEVAFADPTAECDIAATAAAVQIARLRRQLDEIRADPSRADEFIQTVGSLRALKAAG